MLESETLAVRREAALAWLGLHFAQRRLAVFAALEQEDRLLQDTMASRVASGGAMPADALMARQETLELADRRDELQAAVEQARAQLRRWTGEQPELSAQAEPPALRLDLARLLDSLDRHADLLAFAPMLAMARADVEEAVAMRRGDWGWEVAYGIRELRDEGFPISPEVLRNLNPYRLGHINLLGDYAVDRRRRVADLIVQPILGKTSNGSAQAPSGAG